MDLWSPTKKIHKNFNTMARPVWSPACLVIFLRSSCFSGLWVSLVSWPYMVMHVCMVCCAFLYASLVSCVSYALSWFLYCACLCIGGLLVSHVGPYACLPAWSPMALHAFLVSCVSVVLCMSLSLWSPTPYPSPSI